MTSDNLKMTNDKWQMTNKLIINKKWQLTYEKY